MTCPPLKELEAGIVLQDRFDQGRQVGDLAREHFGEGMTINVYRSGRTKAIENTKAALDLGVDALQTRSNELGIRFAPGRSAPGIP